jgi:hypothetical protein
MFESIKKKAVSAKDHVKNNKFAYSASAVAIAAIALQQRNRIAFYAFLEEKGIDPMEYYCPEYFAELQAS